ncbi:MAG: DNA primase [Patescibacteria group bacterium]
MVNSPIEEIKNRLDIIEVIGSYIKLQKTGANFRAVCPFHSEKKPSFFVSPARQIWHCFGCAKGGDIFKFIMEIEGVEFGDALRTLAQKAGIELKPMRRENIEMRSERQRLYEINELATRFFEKQLEGSVVGKEAKEYLIGRKISEDSIKEWRLGYSPDAWQGLLDFLVSKGYKNDEVEKTGLAIRNEKGSFYDRFRGRIMFPVFDLNSQVVGFGGRVFREKDKQEIAKYVNTSNTVLYDKSRVLYGSDKAKLEVRKQDSCVLVEGYVDAIMCHQEGFKNTVAVSGTALTPYQLKVLKRYTENLFLAFDMDVAGDTATKRGIDLAQLQGFNIKIITMKEDSDPADIICEDPKNWERAIADAKSILDFYFETTFSRFDDKTPDGKKSISKILLPVIKRIPNQIEKSHWIQELARKLSVRDDDIIEELKKVKLEEETYGLEKEEVPNLPQKSRRELLEERLVTMSLISPEDCSAGICEEDLEFFSPQISKLFSCLKNKKNSDEDELPEDVRDLFNYLSLKAEVEAGLSKEDIKEEFENCLESIRGLEIKNKLAEISQSLKSAEYEKNPGKISELKEKANKLAQKLNKE